MRSSGIVAALACASLGCSSSGPYTMASAAINTGLALGFAAHERAGGGCYAVCTNGTVCNARTGYCERQPVAPCVRGSPGCGALGRELLGIDELVANPDAAAAKPLGVSPATGRAPSPPPGSSAPAER